jgi:hypothetical protein
MLTNIVLGLDYPALTRVSERLEQFIPFKKYPPVGPGVPKNVK